MKPYICANCESPIPSSWTFDDWEEAEKCGIDTAASLEFAVLCDTCYEVWRLRQRHHLILKRDLPLLKIIKDASEFRE